MIPLLCSVVPNLVMALWFSVHIWLWLIVMCRSGIAFLYVRACYVNIDCGKRYKYRIDHCVVALSTVGSRTAGQAVAKSYMMW